MTFKAQLQPAVFHDSVTENCSPTLQTCILKNLLLGHFLGESGAICHIVRRVPDLRVTGTYVPDWWFVIYTVMCISRG